MASSRVIAASLVASCLLQERETEVGLNVYCGCISIFASSILEPCEEVTCIEAYRGGGCDMIASQRKLVIAGLVGNVLEWYDFSVYGYFAVTIGNHFFPSKDPTTSLLAAFGVF